VSVGRLNSRCPSMSSWSFAKVYVAEEGFSFPPIGGAGGFLEL
jgi:hypothetical protein